MLLRRQELVFIGLASRMDEALIRQDLDACLLNDEELGVFKKETDGQKAPFEMKLGR